LYTKKIHFNILHDTLIFLKKLNIVEERSESVGKPKTAFLPLPSAPRRLPFPPSFPPQGAFPSSSSPSCLRAFPPFLPFLSSLRPLSFPMDSHYWPSQRDRRFCDLSVDVATIMNTGDVDALCAALAPLPRHNADTALFRAAQFNQAFFIAPLVTRCGADVNAVDPRNNETALHSAACAGSTETAIALLDAGADYSKKNKNNSTALTVACSMLVMQGLGEYHRLKAEKMITALVEKAGYVHSRSAWTEATPLSLVASTGNAPMVKLLLAAGAPVNAPAKVPIYKREGDAPTGFWSPLHAAAESGDKAMIELLLAAGADPNGRDAKGRTPLHYAHKHENGCYGALLDAGAKNNAYDSSGKFPDQYY
jgi:ankyrin repeat protein